MKPGDVYASKLPDGRFGAVKILRVTEAGALVAVSKWIGDAPPNKTTPGLSALTHGLPARGTRPAERFQASWYPGAPTKDDVFVGNLPLRPEEASYETDGWSSGWHPFMAAVVLVREGGLPPDELWPLVKKASPPPKPAKPPAAMAEARFWKLIEDTTPGDDEAEKLVAALAREKPAAIRGFHERLARLLYALDGRAYTTKGEYLSPDYFLYQRCGVVALGRRATEAALAAPAPLGDAECEDLLAAAPRALARAKKLDDDDEPEIPTSVSYETGSNQAAWK